MAETRMLIPRLNQKTEKMKTQIETGLSIYSATMTNAAILLYVAEFDRILTACLNPIFKTKEHLKEHFKKFNNYHYFKIYFGSNHLAVIDIQTNNRILFIDFTAQN